MKLIKDLLRCEGVLLTDGVRWTGGHLGLRCGTSQPGATVLQTLLHPVYALEFFLCNKLVLVSIVAPEKEVSAV